MSLLASAGCWVYGGQVCLFFSVLSLPFLYPFPVSLPSLPRWFLRWDPSGWGPGVLPPENFRNLICNLVHPATNLWVSSFHFSAQCCPPPLIRIRHYCCTKVEDLIISYSCEEASPPPSPWKFSAIAGHWRQGRLFVYIILFCLLHLKKQQQILVPISLVDSDVPTPRVS